MHLTPVLKRVGLGKALGLLVGIAAAWSLSAWTAAPATLAWGVALWSLTLGAMIGLVGFYNRVPLVDMALPAWLRGAWCGAWMGIVMILLAYAPLQAALAGIDWLPGMFRSPWWILIDAAIAGALIDVALTRGVGAVSWPGSGVSGGAAT